MLTRGREEERPLGGEAEKAQGEIAGSDWCRPTLNTCFALKFANRCLRKLLGCIGWLLVNSIHVARSDSQKLIKIEVARLFSFLGTPDCIRPSIR